MRRMRRLFCALIAVALLLSCCLFSSASVYAASGYETERFDVEMTVEENHVIHVTETIKVDFTRSKTCARRVSLTAQRRSEKTGRRRVS